jgi:2-dehydro-3-deoxygluconokinase
MTGRVIAFGEVMLRLKAPGQERFLQSPRLEASFGGGEANVAISLARFGLQAAFITALPTTPIADACIEYLRGQGVDTHGIARCGDRMGVYYLEAGANQRPSKVVYDRNHSALMDAPPECFDWDRLLQGGAWFHVTGITPALSLRAAANAVAGMQAARRLGLTVSCDYNFRKNLWKYGREAAEVMPELVRLADVGMANEEDCQRALGITLEDPGWEKQVAGGDVASARYRALAEKVLETFPNLRLQAITLRQSRSADRNGWSACLHNRKAFLTGTEYEIDDIVDRVGTGDAFAAGLIYALVSGLEEHEALEFATAASCLKHSILGDINLSTVAEVRELMAGGGTGRIQR